MRTKGGSTGEEGKSEDKPVLWGEGSEKKKKLKSNRFRGEGGERVARNLSEEPDKTTKLARVGVAEAERGATLRAGAQLKGNNRTKEDRWDYGGEGLESWDGRKLKIPLEESPKR